MNILGAKLFFLLLCFSCNQKSDAIVKYYEDGTTNIYCPIDSDSLAHGIVTHHYPNGTLEVKTEYVHGKKHGIYEVYYKSGNLSWQGQYDSGKASGSFTEYYDAEENQLKSKTCYTNGRENGMYYFFRKNNDTSSYGYMEMDTTKFYVVFGDNGEKEDYFSESAISPKKTTLNLGDTYRVNFKVYGDQKKKVDINYTLINFENDDTISSGLLSDYAFNTDTNLVFTGLEEGRHFIDFKVPMLDTIFIMNSFVTIGDIPDSTFHE